MIPPLVVEIGQMRIDATGRPEDAARIETTLRQGLDLLAERLAHSPFARDPAVLHTAIGQIRIDDLGVEDWLGDRGAARVADILYQRIAEGGAA
ncbi:hypothetical protein QO034_10520 [Sedimentitalea sp. JM2-8]|uniref:Uncharacterized protein n=1 Tax=Sedimentitalea xiamensis TaxID=3050037 RepID=A0ABT7FEJ7_9RHOB|nr:hypothetical protein [Sedimentitalea xiamensis]MDK3073546.1 hypothetical protein [Sedimentitalea xiamensis]